MMITKSRIYLHTLVVRLFVVSLIPLFADGIDYV